MKVLLLGANGQLGTDIQRVVADGESENIQLSPVLRGELDVEHLDSVPEALRQKQFDVLINCTSYHKTDEVEDNGSKAVLVNAHAVEKMAQICQEKKAKFVHISTDYVFSGEKQTPYIETDCPAPLNVYGTTKYFGETLARQECEATYILRVASLFGIAGASGKGGNFVETMIRIAKEKGELGVIDDITMSPTSTYSVAQMIVALLEKDAEPGIYHTVNSGQATWCEFASEIIAMSGVKAKVNPVSSSEFPSRAKRPEYSVLDNTLLSKALEKDIPHWTGALDEYLIAKGYK